MVIIGGAAGVGLALVKQWASEGHAVFACDISGETEAHCANLGATGRRVDITSQSEIEDFFAEILATTDGVDVLVNTVGLPGPRAWAEDVDHKAWTATLAGSVGYSFLCAQQVIPGMKRRGKGAIVNFSSCSARTSPVMRSPYVAAKGALEALTRALARELGPFNIRVNAVSPGAIDNERLRAGMARAASEAGVTAETFEQEALKFVSMRSKIDTRELADAVLFLASDAARHITGQIIAVDAGVEWEA